MKLLEQKKNGMKKDVYTTERTGHVMRIPRQVAAEKEARQTSQHMEGRERNADPSRMRSVSIESSGGGKIMSSG
jgi:hypothetical protein